MSSRPPMPVAQLIGDQPTIARVAAVGGAQSGASVRRGRECPACLERYPMDFRVCPRDATELRDAADDEEPDSLLGVQVGDTFSIVRTIGEGGMARVYEARHVRLPNKRFAIKVLHHMYAQQPTIVARFQREAEAVSGIGHPNVIDVYDVGTTPDGRPYLATEYLDGMDFATLLDERGQLESGAAVHVVRQVCRALSAAHARGVVHRDVKPENVFLIGDMEAPIVKVLDFGISKVETPGGGATLTQTGVIMGTPGYMPPEQARGAKTDHRADIYGVGAMLYRALTGQLPFDSEDAAEALSMVLTRDPPRPRSIEASIPEALELVIQRAMAKEPDDRFRSMTELDERLAPFDPEAQASVSLLPPSPSPRGMTPRPPKAAVHALSQSSGSLARDTREARLSRPTLVVTTVAAYLWIVGCLIDAGTFGLAVLRGNGQPTLTERLIVAITVSAISLTPLIFWLRHIGRIWGNSVNAIQHARILRRVVLSATVPYAFLMLAVRVLPPPVDPRWAPGLSTVSTGIAFLAYLTGLVTTKRR